VAALPATLKDVCERISRRIGPVSVRNVGDDNGLSAFLLSSVEHDHRAISPAGASERVRTSRRTSRLGPLFCCLTGGSHDGHLFARQAAEAGAVAFVSEREVGEAGLGLPELVVGAGRARAAMAEAACVVSGDPASFLETVGVTGTNGKTTTTHLLRSILTVAGREVALVGTLTGERTTPEAPELQRRFRAALEGSLASGRTGAVALEVTSHALVQHRVDGYVHDVAVFTNLSWDHLDFHGTIEDYFAAKCDLFRPEHTRCAVVNGDDPYGRRLFEAAHVPTETFGLHDAKGLSTGPDGSRFELFGREVRLSLAGTVNVENALAAAFAARALGVAEDDIAGGLCLASTVPGRFERVENALLLTVIVDYAHTPVALRNALETVRALAGGSLIVVFGAGGDRDPSKRREMGRVASEHADVVVLTSDNPRHEDPQSIIDQLRSGFEGPAELHVEVDRRRAIALALALGRERTSAGGDPAVLVAGKGHETTQQVGDVLHPFEDRLVVTEEAIRLVGGT
jgi:UDP-N-acetylmuramoyl-L-alanyl-D-glutamate--2,6-diaminopimelate ligase